MQVQQGIEELTHMINRAGFHLAPVDFWDIMQGVQGATGGISSEVQLNPMLDDDPSKRLQVMAHEYGHIALGHEVAGVSSAGDDADSQAEEHAADKWALKWLRERNLPTDELRFHDKQEVDGDTFYAHQTNTKRQLAHGWVMRPLSFVGRCVVRGLVWFGQGVSSPYLPKEIQHVPTGPDTPANYVPHNVNDPGFFVGSGLGADQYLSEEAILESKMVSSLMAECLPEQCKGHRIPSAPCASWEYVERVDHLGNPYYELRKLQTPYHYGHGVCTDDCL